MFKRSWYLVLLIALGCGSSPKSTSPPPVTPTPPPATTYQVSIKGGGTGTGTITSTPAGINCGATCSASFNNGTSVTLTETPNAGSTFMGWGGACSGTTGTCAITVTAAAAVTAMFNLAAPPPPVQYTLTVQPAGTGTGIVSSSPAGINCGSTCSASYDAGTAVTLTAAANSDSTFIGWSNGCTGTDTCIETLTGDTSVTATFNVKPPPATLANSIDHIIVLVQENRSLDNYFGALREYWAQNGYPDQSFDGLPQFNPVTGAKPLKGPVPSNSGCNPIDSAHCDFDKATSISSFHLKTVCTENTSPSWNEAHNDWDPEHNTGNGQAKNDGFVFTAAYDARALGYFDQSGMRAMGYYDWTELPYYYFMASSFGTSDRWFHPVMSRTNINREYLYGATSGGYVYPNGDTPADTPQLKSKTIIQELQDAGVSWKVYVNPSDNKCSGPPYDKVCLIKNLTYLPNFNYESVIIAKYQDNIGTMTEYFSDLLNGTLPQVSFIEPASNEGLDEHGSDTDLFATNIQFGAKYVSKTINALMDSSSWASSALIMTYDENGGLYDHVSPQKTVSPDGIKPLDLKPGAVCTTGTGPTCDFIYTGYRVPLIVVSPFAKKNYVSHTVADYTAILKFIETRFNLPAINRRDAAQMDMTEFFDFANPSWMNPPTPPEQAVNAPCYLNKLP